MVPHENGNEGEIERRGNRSDVMRRRGALFKPLELGVLFVACALFGIVLSVVKRWTHWDPPLWLHTLMIGLVVACVMLWIHRRRSKAKLVG